MQVKHRAKYLDFESCRGVLAPLQQAGKRIVLCHGVFDLIHPGHIAHLQEAKELGDILVVSIIGATYVNRGPGRPIFSDDLRLYSVASLECVDYVLVVSSDSAIEVIERIQPDIYCKGLEYANPENMTPALGAESQRVRALGGEVRYTGSIVYSSTRLINNFTELLPAPVKTYAKSFTAQHTLEQARQSVDAFQKLKVLVIGDIIIDEYLHSSVQGVTAKGRVVSARVLRQEQHLGGALAIARHIGSFTDQVTVVSVMGTEPDLVCLVSDGMEPHIHLDIQASEGYPTVVKRRYVERGGMRDEYTKLFAANVVDDEALGVDARERTMAHLSELIPNFDLVVLADFGHGLVDAPLMELVQSRSRFLALNCQTNTANQGYNLITKYRKVDTFCLDHQELRLAYANRHADHGVLLRRLAEHLKSQQAWLTLGSSGSLGIDSNGDEELAPALTLTVKDTCGAGDAFFALASMSAAISLPLRIGSMLGNLAGSIAANVLGNVEPVTKPKFLKYMTTVLNV